ncbi:MAG: Do family serine endopeptidase [Xanthomonadales bacterium]|nr:Do family serine endopeptidase [Gammaproteobacteria bacterium]MBT8051675.1 Do family serine endopeptidase [Gammaproteobacteria bacterium]MBT8056007.1 Do family serine endopeptidase [Gammaproteobacteria bacterium]NNJ79823.1 Do family serine endopeptidase [Xanthomonadales bacterium]NNL03924.1 Do family serine endopeptidase [Xanthomonadales bacterium]
MMLAAISGIAPSSATAALPVAVDGNELPSLAPVLDRVTPSVVNVYTSTRVRVRSPLLDDPFFRRFFNVPDRARERVSQSLGSGVVVDSNKGYVLTNNHVIEGADDISVTLSDGRSFDAEVIGTDPDTDLAMIRIPAENLDALPFADSNELRVGDFVVAVGNPFGLGQTVTSGIVSALGRSAFRGLEFQNFIQTDASINPGNSGGALINLRGELVGINSAIFTPSGGNVGIGFAIPSAMAQNVMAQLAEFGEVRRGTLGIFVQDLTAELAGAFGLEQGAGVLVAEIDEDSEADRAGIEAGDVIIRLGDFAVGDAQEFHLYEGQIPVGDRVRLEYLRDGRSKSASLEMSALDRLDGGELDHRLLGAVFEDIALKARSNRLSGVLLTELNPESRLARRGMRPGDVVTGANRIPVRDLDEFRKVVSDINGPLYLEIRRGRRDYVMRLD